MRLLEIAIENTTVFVNRDGVKIHITDLTDDNLVKFRAVDKNNTTVHGKTTIKKFFTSHKLYQKDMFMDIDYAELESRIAAVAAPGRRYKDKDTGKMFYVRSVDTFINTVKEGNELTKFTFKHWLDSMELMTNDYEPQVGDVWVKAAGYGEARYRINRLGSSDYVYVTNLTTGNTWNLSRSLLLREHVLYERPAQDLEAILVDAKKATLKAWNNAAIITGQLHAAEKAVEKAEKAESVAYEALAVEQVKEDKFTSQCRSIFEGLGRSHVDQLFKELYINGARFEDK